MLTALAFVSSDQCLHCPFKGPWATTAECINTVQRSNDTSTTRENVPLNRCAHHSNKHAVPCSLISHHCDEEALYPWLSKICPVKILIRLHECAVWSESSLDARPEVTFPMWLVWRGYVCRMIWFCAFHTGSKTPFSPMPLKILLSATSSFCHIIAHYPSS